MTKARILTHKERLEMTQKHSSLLKNIREGKDLPPAYPGAEETNEKNVDDLNCCPLCGTQLVHESGCVKCPNGCWSKCG